MLLRVKFIKINSLIENMHSYVVHGRDQNNVINRVSNLTTAIHEVARHAVSGGVLEGETTVKISHGQVLRHTVDFI